jgi:hypothetical protein
MMTEIVGWSLVAIALILNVSATVLLVRSDFESRYQKTMQGSLVWLVPLVGAIVVIAILTNSTTVGKSASGTDATGVLPGSDGDLNRYCSDDASRWGHGGHEGHSDGGMGHGGSTE